MKKQSITNKILFLFIIFTLIIISIFWLLQSQFFNRYYMYNKVQQMKNYSVRIDELITDNGISRETKDYIEIVTEEINGRISIVDSDDQTIYQAGRVSMNRANKIPSIHLDQARSGKIQHYNVSGKSSPIDLLSVLIPIKDKIYIFQTPLQHIEEAVAISQKFTFYLLFIAFFIALILSLVFSNTITGPLLHLNKVAKEMGQLNFDVRCNENRKDEIGELGKTLNFLTEKLKSTIEELKDKLEKERKIDKMRKQFIARVSHELQTPIALISGYTEALQDGIAIDEDEENEYFSIIEGETIKMSNLIKDLLDLGQLESGSFKINMESFNIISIIEHSLLKFELLKNEKNLSFSISKNTDWEEVIGDEYRIEQVLSNLLQNAVNHCNTGGLINIIIDEDQDKIKISIYNEGDQIKDQDKDEIWESFYKIKEDKKGTGLGLAIVKNVLQLHKSQYGIVNEKMGVTFFFTLTKSFL